MSARHFSKGEAVLFGWDALKRNLLLIAEIAAIILVINLILGGLASSLTEEAPSELRAGVAVLSWVLNALIDIGLIRIALDLYDAKRPGPRELLSGTSLLINYTIGFLIYTLMVFLGVVLLVVPGIYLAIRYQFYSYLIVDKGMGPVEALKSSSKITEGSRWNLALFWLMLLGINLLGALALGIGLLATIPLSWLATAFVYRSLACPRISKGIIALPEP